MSKVKIKTGFSQEKKEEEAVSEVFEKIKQEKMSLIIMFADGGYDQKKINEAWHKKLPQGTAFLGSSSLKITTPFFKIGKNLTPEGFKEGLTAMSLTSDKITVAIKLMKNIKEDWKKESSQALIEAAKDLNLDLKNLDPKRCFGLFLADTTSAREDDILESLYTMSNLTFVGGGSMGKMGLNEFLIRGEPWPGSIHTREGVFSNSAIIALIKCDVPFKIDLTTSLYSTKTKFIATKTDGMIIKEFNGKPALEEYTRALGVSKFILGPKKFPNLNFYAAHPLGLMIGNRAYIRFIATREGNSLHMASRVKEGQTLYLMERGDILKTTKEAMEKLKEELGIIRGMILFNCGLRSLEADRLKISEDLFEIMNIAPLIGPCTFREYYGWLAMEYSLAILAIGDY